MRSLIIRADASNKIGTGHLMRCLALAQAWQDNGGRVILLTACHNETLLQRLREEGLELHVLPLSFDLNDWDNIKDTLAAHPGDWVVMDGYHFSETYQQQIKDAGHRLLVIDDMAHLKHYYADIVLNQNLHAKQLRYSGEPDTHLLLGTRYVLLRREFLPWRGWKREIPEVGRRVLVTLGGSDSENHTLKVVQALQGVDVPGLEASVVIGASNPHAKAIEETIKQGHLPIRLIQNAKNMPELMAAADVAISSAGTTVWELVFMATPAIVAATTPIEEFLLSGLKEHGLFTCLNWLGGFSEVSLADYLDGLIGDRKTRLSMSKLGRQLVDGNGGDRVLKYLLAEGG